MTTLLNANTIELHYLLKDESHLMDAYIHNKCEAEFLGVLKEIAAVFDAEILIETMPLGEGGLRKWFKIVAKEEGEKAIITTAVITAIITAVFITPMTTLISNVTEKVIENVFEDDEIKDLEKENLKLENEKLKQEIKINNEKLNSSYKIKKKRSNFYESINSLPKSVGVEFLVENDHHQTIIESNSVYKSDYKNFILTSDNIAPIENESANIEIISPVLKKGDYKWMGVFMNDAISFSMKSNEFKTLVQTGKIQFKNGTTINCHLLIRRKIDNEGAVKIVGYDILRVNEYFENDNPVETPEGKRHRQKTASENRQIDFLNKLDFEN